MLSSRSIQFIFLHLWNNTRSHFSYRKKGYYAGSKDLVAPIGVKSIRTLLRNTREFCRFVWIKIVLRKRMVASSCYNRVFFYFRRKSFSNGKNFKSVVGVICLLVITMTRGPLCCGAEWLVAFIIHMLGGSVIRLPTDSEFKFRVNHSFYLISHTR